MCGALQVCESLSGGPGANDWKESREMFAIEGYQIAAVGKRDCSVDRVGTAQSVACGEFGGPPGQNVIQGYPAEGRQFQKRRCHFLSQNAVSTGPCDCTSQLCSEQGGHYDVDAAGKNQIEQCATFGVPGLGRGVGVDPHTGVDGEHEITASSGLRPE
jgi:hypothetical protein